MAIGYEPEDDDDDEGWVDDIVETILGIGYY
jgi:hypothetical protein